VELSKRVRVRLRCRICDDEVRTSPRNTNPLCKECRQVALQNSLGLQAEVQVDDKKYLNLDRMPESVWQQILFKQVELDGMPHLGYGPLRFLHPLQRTSKRYGRWTEGSLEFDLLLRSCTGIVCIEIKKCADRSSLIQAMDYKSYLENNRRNPGDVKVCLVTVRLEKTFEDLMKEAWSSGLNIDLYCVDISNKGLSLRRVGPELPEYDP
jgi:hypothetical protein